MEPTPEIRFEGYGPILRQLREDAGIGVRDLARRMECSHSRISKIESNALSISMTMLEQLATALELPPETVVLRCLERRYPQLQQTPAGKLMSNLLSLSGGDE